MPEVEAAALMDELDEDLPVAMPLVGLNFDDFDDDDDDDMDYMDDANIAAVLAPPNRHRNDNHQRQRQRRNNDGDDDDPLQLLLLDGPEAAREVSTASSFLHGMIQDPETTCTSVLGWGPHACHHVVERCRSVPDDVYYVDMRNGRTPLHEACLKCSCLHIISALLEVNPGRVMATDGAGNTPLHLLMVGVSTRALADMGAIVDALLSKSACGEQQQQQQPANATATALTSICNRAGNTSLHMACLAPETMIHRESFQTILDANPMSAARLNTKSQSPLALHCMRRRASTQIASMLLQAYPNAIHILDTINGYSPLHYACENANSKLIQLLLEHNSGVASLRTTTQLETPLHLLCCYKNIGEAYIPAIQHLLRADKKAVLARDAVKGYTPLHLVCRCARVPRRVVEILVAAEAASIRDSNHYLPLHHACEIGATPKVIACLLDAYPEGAKAVTKKNDSALSLACACNKSTETVGILIHANPRALTERNHYGFVPLHCVCGSVQPRVGIVQAILGNCPQSAVMKSHGGETALHIASGNPGTFVGIIELLTANTDVSVRTALMKENQQMTNKVGNTPLHHACFRGSPFEHIETLAMSNPQWVKCPNNAGYTALQIMCKNARLHDRVITTFSRIGGPGVFSIVDMSGNTPLHSAMREETDIEALRCLIRAYPDALIHKTTYGDTPLHLAVTRRVKSEAVREIAISSNESLLLTPNTAGQTPMGIAMEEFESVCKANCASCAKSELLPCHQRAFEVLAAMVKILHYGSSQLDDRDRTGSLVRACMSLHRRDVRLNPAFILRALRLHPEEARLCDDLGNYPLHIEASIPVEKMSLLSAPGEGCRSGGCHKRMNILRTLFDIYPAACKLRNNAGEFPLGLMIQSGRAFDQTFALVLRSFPQALHWSIGVNNKIFPLILSKLSRECGMETLYTLIHSRPDIATRVQPSEMNGLAE